MKTISFLAALCLASPAWADTPEKMLEELRAEVRAELRASLEKDGAEKNDENSERLIRLESILIEEIPDREVTAGKLDKTLAGLMKLRTATHSTKAEGLVGDLILEVGKAIAHERQAFADAYHPALRKAMLEGLKTDEEGEIDATLQAMQAMKRKLEEFTDSEGNQLDLVNADELEAIATALRGWQNGLIGLKTQPSEKWTALAALQEMEQNYDEQMSEVVPRSEFMKLVHAARARWKLDAFRREEEARRVAETRKILKAVKNLEGLTEAIDGLRALQTSAEPAPQGPDEPEVVTDTVRVINALGALKEEAWDLKMGISSALPTRPHGTEDFRAAPVSAELASPEGGTSAISVLGAVPPAFEAELLGIYEMLLHEAVPAVLGVEQPFAAGESAVTYLRRIAGQAIQEKKWVLLGKSLDGAEQLGGARVFAAHDEIALRSVLAALNQERAHRYPAAVASYLVALRSGSQIAPAEWIGEQLAALQKEHADDYQAGQKLEAEPLPQVQLPAHAPASRVFDGVEAPRLPPVR